MKPIKCYYILNTSWGYCCQPVKCNSIRQAIMNARASGMRYRVFDEAGRLRHSG